MTFVRCLTLAGAIVLVASIDDAGKDLRIRLNDAERRFENIPSRNDAELVAEPLSLPVARKLNDLEEAYLDSYSILKQENSCSEFFGGPKAIEALNELAKQLRPVYLDRHVGLRMTGKTTSVLNIRNGFKYRLFEKAEVNLNGPFYRTSALPNSPSLSLVGTFRPSSREARVTLLLHELGHLIQKPDDNWLLRDDGKDTRQSEENTRRVIEACGKQIRELHRFSFAEELQSQLKARSESVVTASPEA